MSGLLAALVAASTTGCYYGHLASGQARLMLARRAIDDVLADPDTATPLRAQLHQVESVRAFAVELGLAVDDEYTSYAPWPGDRIITSVVATRPGEIDAVEQCHPIVGCVPYQGFFDQEAAERRAETLREQGLDVCLVPVSAYSTLGWISDPVTDPMLQRGEVDLAVTLLHELVHATVFARSQPEFNEGLATFVGQEAAIRYFARHPASDPQAGSARDRILDQRTLALALVSAREAVAALYAEELPEAERVQRRSDLEARTRAQLSTLSLRSVDGERLRALADQLQLNDACLALRGTYAGDLPRYAAVLEALDGDLPRFIARARELQDADDPRAALFALVPR